MRPDGSWPIDTNLATWVTTLAVNALAAAGDLESLDTKEPILAWLLGQQYKDAAPVHRRRPRRLGVDRLAGWCPRLRRHAGGDAGDPETQSANGSGSPVERLQAAMRLDVRASEP